MEKRGTGEDVPGQKPVILYIRNRKLFPQKRKDGAIMKMVTPFLHNKNNHTTKNDKAVFFLVVFKLGAVQNLCHLGNKLRFYFFLSQATHLRSSYRFLCENNSDPRSKTGNFDTFSCSCNYFPCFNSSISN